MSKKLFQHRSLALAMPRTSTAIFNSRRADWDFRGVKEPSIVYNCRSDTEKLLPVDDILLSTTYLIGKPWTFSIMYGCPLEFTDDIIGQFKRFKRFVFHPLIVPMIFVEYERKRFIKALNMNGTKLTQRIMDLENRLDADREHARRPNPETNREMTERDCEGTKLWVEVSGLKIGLESLRKVLLSVEEQSQTFHDLRLRPDMDDTREMIRDSMTSDRISSRLQEIMTEIESKIKTCEGLLSGMALAIQVEWNYHTRRDAKANIIIAHASKQDSTQMRLISLVGMIFLPGTFLATLFSMSFFRWIPDDSAEIMSPWIAVYFGLTAIITGVTIWRWKTWKAKDDQGIEDFISQVIDRNDVEKGSTGPGDSRRSRISKEASNSNSIEMQEIKDQQATC
ncbi:hypothetical protein SCAR479_02502 [Seiridium cardinale]|uniref:Magnesium transporter n=1 Tax=Seiridium cardinale TaxID=138064 RepID=A0ABR2Y2W3_9PEZI